LLEWTVAKLTSQSAMNLKKSSINKAMQP